ncbi:DEAD/DEAH box helicase family protein [Paenibacillus sp. ATY16]|uniref:DEAD/DEAH box helicase family protein n=1 Tax=Paenibacillus sp. ATY16 TaxID=1759312 RepID=UPI0020106D60|nr:DEAD/DEAH box helicase family protein [Paenibacillus sp. ATY16]MCK9858201.1 DEAD/DEAH box helicase family protein [Paenibacillus sp. ATY16]
MEKKYLITNEEFEIFERGKFYGLYSEPGAGKTQTAKDIILPYCKDNGLSVLFLTHRNALKNQTKADLDGFLKQIMSELKGNMLEIVNYQKLENDIKNYDNASLIEIYSYDVIICDEAHYFVDDSWNGQSQISLEFLKNNERAIKLFMTGTPKPLESLNKSLNIKILTVPNRENNNLNRIYVYSSFETLDTDMKNYLENKENKAMIFFDKTTEAFKASENLYESSAFICSRYNRDFKDQINNAELSRIIKDGNFESQVICSTSVLEAGINILDDSVKTVAYMRPRTIQSVQQAFARVRSTKIYGIIYKPTHQAITKELNKVDGIYRQFKELELIDEIGLDRYINDGHLTIYVEEVNRTKRNKIELPGFITISTSWTDDGTPVFTHMLNEMYVVSLHNKKWQFEYILEHGFAALLHEYYPNIPIVEVDKELDRQKLTKYLESLVDVQLFDQKQEQFILALKNDYKIRRSQGREVRKPNELNRIFEQMKINFSIIQKRTRIDGLQIRYWAVTKSDVPVIYTTPSDIVTDEFELVIDRSERSDFENVQETKPEPEKIGKKSFKEIIESYEFLKQPKYPEQVVTETSIKELKIENDIFTGRPIVFNEKTQEWERYWEHEWVNGEKLEVTFYKVPDVPPIRKVGSKSTALEAMLASRI